MQNAIIQSIIPVMLLNSDSKLRADPFGALYLFVSKYNDYSELVIENIVL